MSERPTIKLKPGAKARDPQRSRVRAGSAPRTAAASERSERNKGEAPASARNRPSFR